MISGSVDEGIDVPPSQIPGPQETSDGMTIFRTDSEPGDKLLSSASDNTADSALPHRAPNQDKAAVNCDFWTQAYNKLSKEKSDLVQQYEKLFGDSNVTFDGSEKRLMDAIRARVDERQTKQIVLNLQSRDIKIRDAGEKIVRFLIWSKDLASTAVPLQPHAALAIASISFLLLLVLESGLQAQQMLEGLHEICRYIQLYEIRQSLYQNADTNPQFEIALVQLYFNILQCEAALAVYLSHMVNMTMVEDLQEDAQFMSWVDMLDAMKSSANQCEVFTDAFNQTEEQKRLEIQSEQIHHTYSNLLQMRTSLNYVQKLQLALLENDQQQDFFTTFSSSYARDKNINPKRVLGTCEWFLKEDSFQKWRDSAGSQILWVSADPGCGKSVLSRCLIDEARAVNSILSSTICYFFFKDSIDGRRRGENALGAILHQFYDQNPRPELWSHTLARIKSSRAVTIKDHFDELWSILIAISKDPLAGNIVCIVDALDECQEDARTQFIDALTEFYTDEAQTSQSTLKFLVTSRPYEDLKLEFRSLSSQATMRYLHCQGEMESEQIAREIDLVIDDQIPRVANQLSQADQRAIAEHLKSMQNRTYLWAYIIFDVIKKGASRNPTLSRIKGLIQTLPNSINKAYEQILSRVPDEELQRARWILQIVLAAKRSLTATEVLIALEAATNDSARCYEDLDIPSDEACASMIRDICGLCIYVSGDNKVSFLHQTFREFLLPHNQKGAANRSSVSADAWEGSFDLVDAEMFMTEACVKFLHFQEYDVSPPWGTHDKLDTSAIYGRTSRRDKEGAEMNEYVAKGILEYAAHFWTDHYRNYEQACGQDSISKMLLSGSMALCDTATIRFFVWWPILCERRRWLLKRNEHSLTVACTVGLQTLVQALLNEETDGDIINLTGGIRQFPLMAAAYDGYESIVKLLIDAGANIEQTGLGMNVLAVACKGGHLSIVELLIDKGAAVNPELMYWSPLSAACSANHVAIFNLLISKGADPNLRVRMSRRPAIYEAAANSSINMVELLIQHGADINATTSNNGTSLMAAISRKASNVVKLLLKHGATTDGLNNGKDTALTLALNPNLWVTEIIEALLEYDIDVNIETTGGDALTIACRSHLHDTQIVEKIIDKGADINRRHKSLEGQTALHVAAVMNHYNAVKLLLERGAQRDIKDDEGKIPLDLASDRELKNLLQNTDNDTDWQDSDGSVGDENSDVSVDDTTETVVSKESVVTT